MREKLMRDHEEKEKNDRIFWCLCFDKEEEEEETFKTICHFIKCLQV